MWIYGGKKPCGVPDLTLAREACTKRVMIGEKTIGDRGYNDGTYFINPYTNPESNLLQKRIMCRHETVNKRIKQFGVLSKPFRHDLDDHCDCFVAVCHLVQLMIRNGEPLFALDI